MVWLEYNTTKHLIIIQQLSEVTDKPIELQTLQRKSQEMQKCPKLALTTEDLSLALGDQGVNVRKPPYYQ